MVGNKSLQTHKMYRDTMYKNVTNSFNTIVIKLQATKSVKLKLSKTYSIKKKL